MIYDISYLIAKTFQSLYKGKELGNLSVT